MSGARDILLIDDNRAWRETLADYLRSKGLAVVTAGNASQGMAVLEHRDVSLVVCDCHMPGMDGLELVRVLHRSRRLVAILMMSSDQEPSLARRVMAAGAWDFLEKTSSPSVLLRKVRQILASLDSVLTGASRPWQRLLPSPDPVGRKRSEGRSAAHAPRPTAVRRPKRRN